MKLKNMSPKEEIRADIANRLTLPLVVLDSLRQDKKVNKKLIIKNLS